MIPQKVSAILNIYSIYKDGNWYYYIKKKKLQQIENLLNNMSRNILGYKTPNQVYNEKLKLASNSLV